MKKLDRMFIRFQMFYHKCGYCVNYTKHTKIGVESYGICVDSKPGVYVRYTQIDEACCKYATKILLDGLK